MQITSPQVEKINNHLFQALDSGLIEKTVQLYFEQGNVHTEYKLNSLMPTMGIMADGYRFRLNSADSYLLYSTVQKYKNRGLKLTLHDKHGRIKLPRIIPQYVEFGTCYLKVRKMIV